MLKVSPAILRFQLQTQFLLTDIKDGGTFSCDQTPTKMNDFLRPCNCVNPAEEDCDKCIEETALKKVPGPCEEKAPEKEKPKAAESEKKS